MIKKTTAAVTTIVHLIIDICLHENVLTASIKSQIVQPSIKLFSKSRHDTE